MNKRLGSMYNLVSPIVSCARRAGPWRLAIELVLLPILVLVLSGCGAYAVVDIAYEPGHTKYADPVLYVDERWGRSVGTLTQQASDLREVLDTLAARPRMAEEKYGHCPTKGIATGHRNHNFIIKSEGKVLKVSTESRAGTMTVDIPPYDGFPDATIQIGPVVRLESIRNSLDFMAFDDFENQPAWANCSKELKARFLKIVQESIVNSLAPGSGIESFYDIVPKLKGKTISFYGCFTLTHRDDYSDVVEDYEEILITLTKIEIKQ